MGNDESSKIDDEMQTLQVDLPIKEEKSITIGISIGSKNICFGVWDEGNPKILFNQPGLISFTEDEILFGQEAKEQYIKNPKNSICEIQRIIGKKIFDDDIQKLALKLPFELKKGYNEKILVNVFYKSKKRNMIFHNYSQF